MAGRDTWGGHWSSSWLQHWSPSREVTPPGAFIRNVVNPFEEGFEDGTDFHKARPQVEKKTRARLEEEARLSELAQEAADKLENIEIQIEQKQALAENRGVRRALASLEAQHHKTEARLTEIQARLAEIRFQAQRDEEDEDEAMLLLLAYH